ncbi:DNA cytosine methyltransferase, partial [Crocinitomix sp.]|nr:DNA cytosine methyltransferase [Crocinitomix sp.]
HKSTTLHKNLVKSDKEDWILTDGVLGQTFKSSPVGKLKSDNISNDLLKVSNDFNKGVKLSPFENSGVYLDGQFYTIKTTPKYDGKVVNLGDILEPLENIPQEFYITEDTLEKWEYLKGAKNEQRFNKAQGYHYRYNEGSMIFPDPLNKPSRTIITGEGGKSASRFKHVVNQNGTLRRLTPIELERLNMFPDNHTLLEGITDAKRAFFMGNALVVGVVEKIGKTLAKVTD